MSTTGGRLKEWPTDAYAVDPMQGKLAGPVRPQDRTWYLAHPLGADRHYSFQQNVAHIQRVMAILWEDAKLLTIAPYLEQIKFLDNNNPNERRIGLLSDCEVVHALGRVILVGHRFSEGMQDEIAALGVWGQVINCIGIPDRKLWQFIPRQLI